MIYVYIKPRLLDNQRETVIRVVDEGDAETLRAEIGSRCYAYSRGETGSKLVFTDAGKIIPRQ